MKKIYPIIFCMLFTLPLTAGGTLPDIAEKTRGMQKFTGLFTFYYDAAQDKIWLEIDRFGQEFLYVNSLSAGLGSNDIGLDRNQLGNSRIVYFERIGPKVLLVQPNYRYRANSSNAKEVASVQDAFARSVLWGFTVAAQSGERVLVDAGGFFLRDAHDVIGVLKRRKQGSYKLDPQRSAFYLPRIKNFPHNSEFEVTLTFTGTATGAHVRSVAPTSSALTVRQHHSFVQLPDDGYTPRATDPRAGYFGITYQDYATPFDQPLVRQYISRHRLRKKNPAAEKSEPVEPIVYYVDSGVPEPIRSALIEGASWWNQAFEAAGYIDAFRVEVLPDSADPMDVRYNVINWVHRSTRGWSYGSSVRDPRTGEIIKGHVLLGSLRIRQDFMIAAGLTAPYGEEDADTQAAKEMALARIRQLSAHEVGHTLGLAHNFAASTVNRASVMDYPHPLITLDEQGRPDLSNAYATGIGEWDKVTITWGYQDFPPGTDEAQGLENILRSAYEKGLFFLSDADARPAGAASFEAHLWDNGTDAAGELERILRVRQAALQRFSQRVIPMGTPMSRLEEVLVPIYLLHRYQADAAAKLVGGLVYRYALRGDGQTPVQPLSADKQRTALETMLKVLQPQQLAIPEKLLAQMPPRTFGYTRSRELFRNRMLIGFDPLSPAEAAADQILGLLLNPQRAARLVAQHARDKNLPGLQEVIDRIVQKTWRSAPQQGYAGELQRSVNFVLVTRLMRLAADESALPQARALARQALVEMQERPSSTKDRLWRAHYAFIRSEIAGFLADPKQDNIPSPLPMPPGSPIGQNGLEACGWF